jgi:alkylation response protein AidB-like acyl-CoA dehydrogenase
MDFHDSETQRLLRGTARAYLAAQYPWERLYAIERGDARLSDTDLRALEDLGWQALVAPEAAGGSGASLLEAAVIIEELGYAAAPAPVLHSNVASSLLGRAPEPAAREHLRRLVSGKARYTVAEANRDTGAPTGRVAEPLRGAEGRLAGELPLVPFAEESDIVITPLSIDGEPALAAVPLRDAALAPVRMLDHAPYGHVRFDGLPIDAADVIASGPVVSELREECNALITAFSLIEMAGMMQRVLEMTSSYISTRTQFGKPIATFQAARHRAAELLTQTETTRWAAYHALWRFECDPRDAEEIWLAKHWANRAADRVYQISHLLHGGVGVGIEYPLHLLTQGIAALAVRGGAMDELVERSFAAMST